MSTPPDSLDPSAARPAARARLLAAAVCLVWGLVYAAFVSRDMSWGWDESMHAELPAARMSVAAAHGEWGSAGQTLVTCNQYPFVYPLVLAGVQLVSGPSETACRMVSRLLWALGAFGLFLLAQELARGSPPRRGAATPWIALFLFLTSPLFINYSGTLFLEVPFAVASAFTLRAWWRRPDVGEPAAIGRELCAGAWFALCFFTKFNYGLLLGLALALDSLPRLVRALRAGGGAPRGELRALATFAVLPLLAGLWWFVFPWPGDLRLGRQHWGAFTAFLGGNLERDPVSWTLRAFDLTHGLVWSPRAALAVVLAALVALGSLRERRVQSLLACTLALALPIALHPFCLDRFWIVPAVPFFLLAAYGLARFWPTRSVTAAALGIALALACGFGSAWFSGGEKPRLPWDSRMMKERLLGPAPNPEVGQYQVEMLAGKRDVRPHRPLSTAGLPRAEARHLLDLMAAELGPEESHMWLGGASELAPAAQAIGLYQRQGNWERFLDESRSANLLTVEDVDPGLEAAAFFERAGRYDAVFSSDPPDIGGRQNHWLFMPKYRDMLRSDERWTERELGEIALVKPIQRKVRVRLFVARRVP